MKKILLNARDKLLLQAICIALEKTGDFIIDVDYVGNPNTIIEKCNSNKYDILFMDVSSSYPCNIDNRKQVAGEIRKSHPNMKIVLYCDSNTNPNASSIVRDLKAINLIDAFFYESVDDKYMIAILESL